MTKQELKKYVEEYEIDYDYEKAYCDIRNACIDYENDSQDWNIDYAFEEFVDEDLLNYLVKYKIDNEGLWSVVNLVSDINNYNGIYRVDAYGYGYDITRKDLEDLKEDILDRLKED